MLTTLLLTLFTVTGPADSVPVLDPVRDAQRHGASAMDLTLHQPATSSCNAFAISAGSVGRIDDPAHATPTISISLCR
jgi:hypothetical protein